MRVCLFIFTMCLIGIAQDEELKFKEGYEKLLSDKKEVSDEGAKELETARTLLCERLLKLLDSDPTTVCYDSEALPSKYNAIVVLGKYKYEPAIDKIIDNFFYGYGLVFEEMLPCPYPPSIDALVNMGKPAVDALLKRLEQKPIEETVRFQWHPDRKDVERSWDNAFKRRLLISFYTHIISKVYGGFTLNFIAAQIDIARKDRKDLLEENLQWLALSWKDTLPKDYWQKAEEKLKKEREERNKQREQEKQKQQESEKSQ